MPEMRELDLIVGAHTHSFLYTGTPPELQVGIRPPLTLTRLEHAAFLLPASCRRGIILAAGLAAYLSARCLPRPPALLAQASASLLQVH
jgi:hypothetical protein